MATYEEIMAEIKSNLTGDFQQDVPMLMEAAKQHKDGEFAHEIARECGRLMFAAMPEDKKAELLEAVEEDQAHSFEPLDEWMALSQNCHFEDALKAIEPYAQKLFQAQEGGMCAEDSVTKYYNFDNMIEFLLIQEYESPGKDVREAIAPFSLAFGAYASTLYDLGRFEESIVWNMRAIHWKPCSFPYYMEVAENYKQLGNMNLADKASDKAYNFIVSRFEMARWLRCKGFIAVEREEYELAASLFFVSLGVMHSEAALSELIYIDEVSGFDVESLDVDEAYKIVIENGYPIMPPEANLRILHALLPLAAENEDELVASICADSLYFFTSDPMIREKYCEYLTSEDIQEYPEYLTEENGEG